jgi:hypothetical protein
MIYTIQIKMKLPANYIYVKMLDDERETVYQQWCQQNNLDSTVEYSVIEFFSAIDGITEQEPVE